MRAICPNNFLYEFQKSCYRFKSSAQSRTEGKEAKML